jgi:hypothetical protein
MDNEALKLIARLKIAAARVGIPIDVVRFAADRNFARAALQNFAAHADEDGTVLALTLMHKLGMTAGLDAKPATAPAVEPPRAPAAVDSKYIGRLR